MQECLQRVLGLLGGLLPVGRALTTSLGRLLGGILTKCLNLIWPLLERRSSGSTPNSSQMAELLTLSLGPSPATLRWKLISAACPCDLDYPKLVTIVKSINKDRPVNPRRTGAESTSLQTTDWSACQSPAPFSPHWWTRPRGTWTPPLGAGSPPRPREGTPYFYSREPWPQIWRCWFSSRPVSFIQSYSPTAKRVCEQIGIGKLEKVGNSRLIFFQVK